MSERRAPPGILCALITSFKEDQSPDLDALAHLVDIMVARGVHGLFVLGTTGEGVLLPEAERKGVARLVVEHAAGRVPVVVHCGAPDTRTAQELAAHAEASGADAVAAVAPYYYRYGPRELFGHFAAVAGAAPSIAHYLYENPGVTGYSMGVGVVRRLVSEVSNILGVKDTGDSIGRLTAYLAQPGIPPEVYAGNNSIIFPALVIGARGAVSALANAVPELVVGVYEAWREGRQQEARERQVTLARLHGALADLPFVGAVKYLAERRGLPAGRTRAPLALLTPSQASALEQRLAELPDLSPWLGRIEEGAERGALR